MRTCRESKELGSKKMGTGMGKSLQLLLQETNKMRERGEFPTIKILLKKLCMSKSTIYRYKNILLKIGFVRWKKLDEKTHFLDITEDGKLFLEYFPKNSRGSPPSWESIRYHNIRVTCPVLIFPKELLKKNGKKGIVIIDDSAGYRRYKTHGKDYSAFITEKSDGTHNLILYLSKIVCQNERGEIPPEIKNKILRAVQDIEDRFHPLRIKLDGGILTFDIAFVDDIFAQFFTLRNERIREKKFLIDASKGRPELEFIDPNTSAEDATLYSRDFIQRTITGEAKKEREIKTKALIDLYEKLNSVTENQCDIADIIYILSKSMEIYHINLQNIYTQKRIPSWKYKKLELKKVFKNMFFGKFIL